MNDKIEYAIGFFVEPWRRDLLRFMHEIRLPAIVPNSLKANCSQCQVLLWLGPRQGEHMKSHPEIKPICPICLLQVLGEGEPDGYSLEVSNLNNPDSKFEE